MKQRLKVMFSIVLALLLLFCVSLISIAFFEKDVPSDSIGIIGGADGPTAILIARTSVLESPMILGACSGFRLRFSNKRAFGRKTAETRANRDRAAAENAA